MGSYLCSEQTKRELSKMPCLLNIKESTCHREGYFFHIFRSSFSPLPLRSRGASAKSVIYFVVSQENNLGALGSVNTVQPEFQRFSVSLSQSRRYLPFSQYSPRLVFVHWNFQARFLLCAMQVPPLLHGEDMRGD